MRQFCVNCRLPSHFFSDQVLQLEALPRLVCNTYIIKKCNTWYVSTFMWYIATHYWFDLRHLNSRKLELKRYYKHNTLALAILFQVKSHGKYLFTSAEFQRKMIIKMIKIVSEIISVKYTHWDPNRPTNIHFPSIDCILSDLLSVIFNIL